MTASLTPRKRTALYGIAGFKEHLIIVCSDPFFYPSQGCDVVVSVNVTTWRDKANVNDDACILDVGDHPFIQHKSFVYYEQAVVLRVPLLVERLQSGDFKLLEPVSESVFNRILRGFFVSAKTPRKLMSLLKPFD